MPRACSRGEGPAAQPPGAGAEGGAEDEGGGAGGGVGGGLEEAAGGPLLEVLARLERAYQRARAEGGGGGGAGAAGAKGGPADGGQQEPVGGTAAAGGACVVPAASTAGGRCNFFAPIARDLHVWRDGGVSLEDVVRAFRPVTDQKTLLLRFLGDELVLVAPQRSHLEADFGAGEPTCLANALLGVLAQADLPPFDVVLNHGDLPILRRSAGQPPFYGPTDREARVPAPLFSICGSVDFWDILFPNVCRPALVNMSLMSPWPWREKRPVALWRGTDRGAANWARELGEMYRGSPRKRFLEAWGGSEGFDVAFLEDDLLNATVVNTDPNFVPLSRAPEWRYLLDLPGNGYSGSLKQKLTSSSAVLLLTDVGVPGASPVYEHYHLGLRDGVHVLHVAMSDAGERLRWARGHDGAMQQIVRHANEYMGQFKELTQCYLWHLLDEYAKLLLYRPAHEQLAAFGSGTSSRAFALRRRPAREEAERFQSNCRRLLEEHAQ